MGSHATTENLARCNEFTVAFATKNTMVASDFVGIVSAKNDPEKMQLITYEPIHHGYICLGERVGNAFLDGKRLK